MKDTHEANLPTEENGKLEETKAPETTPENTAEEVVTNETTDAEVAAEETSEAEVKTDEVAAGEETVATTGKLSKEEILEKLTGLVGAAADATRNEVEALKQAYYKIHRSEVDELKKAFLTAGGEEKDFVAPEDETESKIKELLNVYKEKRAAILAEEERVKAANYALKLQLIDQLKALTESQEDFNKLYNDFKDIQQRWKEVKAVPQEHVSELWKNYQTYSEMFYDIIKINNQFRDYDFKKNLEMKTALCETGCHIRFPSASEITPAMARNRSGSERTARRPLVPLQSRFHNHQQTPSGAFRRIESEGTGKPGSQDSHLRTDRKHRFPGFEIIQRLGRKK